MSPLVIDNGIATEAEDLREELAAEGIREPKLSAMLELYANTRETQRLEEERLKPPPIPGYGGHLDMADLDRVLLAISQRAESAEP